MRSSVTGEILISWSTHSLPSRARDTVTAPVSAPSAAPALLTQTYGSCELHLQVDRGFLYIFSIIIRNSVNSSWGLLIQKLLSIDRADPLAQIF